MHPDLLPVKNNETLTFLKSRTMCSAPSTQVVRVMGKVEEQAEEIRVSMMRLPENDKKVCVCVCVCVRARLWVVSGVLVFVCGWGRGSRRRRSA